MLMQTTYIMLEIKHAKEIKDLTDLVAGRAYTLDGVEDVTATIVPQMNMLKVKEQE